ncbi:helicase-exonuclease AddAB subunit AddA [Neomoorella humiferrea]|uniref:ATP-dependent helicase/nuclease subunit A n=1 Tax=Neomoorella humiferrea TaxID=676965 RepID=A0A2T0AWJ3_9FIRM|nr:helicase-exonuclease AddAB subunit AddA [Moorella humiferrea]PRR75100.1 ATP-dependent helicase/nuclease subunit A [Moorella humiferrea]
MVYDLDARAWTDEQLNAINTRRGNLLVAAAAGAGKTAVLVERIIRRLTDPVAPISLENLLVVTFTEAAAAEMRQRIGAALEGAAARRPDDENLRRQLLLLNRAHISTIHSFCLWVLRTYFYRLDLDPAFKVMDPAEADLLQLEVMDQVLEECFTAEPEGGPITELADSLGGRGDANLVDLVLKVWRFTRSLPRPETWLAETATCCYSGEGPLEKQIWYPEVKEALNLRLEEAEYYLRRAAKLAAGPGGPAVYLDNLIKEEELIKELRKELDLLSWGEVCKRLISFTFGRLKPVRDPGVDAIVKERAVGYRERAKKLICGIQEELCRDGAAVKAELGRAAGMARALVEVVRRFDGAYAKIKRDRGLVDFGDLEHFCLKILMDQGAPPGELRPSDVALELRRRFDEVLVDEYQDINGVQDAILTLVSRQGTPDDANLFMVGDVKQSIYRFRLANPELFLDKYHDYPEREGGPNRRIILKANFRSRKAIVDGVNFVFRQLFSRHVGELEYDDDAALICRANYPEHPEAAPAAIEAYILEGRWDGENTAEFNEADDGYEDGSTDLEDLTALEREARLVARRVKQLVHGTSEKPGPEFKVWDAEGKTYRDLSYRDIVILLRATRDRAAVFLEALQQEGIPAHVDAGGSYFAAVEVETVLSLLRIIDNPHQDIPLAAVLRSPIVGLTAADLARIRLAAPEKDFFTAVIEAAGTAANGELAARLGNFLTRLERWRTMARRRPLPDVLWELYRETGYLEFVGGLPGGARRQANLRALLDRARQFEGFARHGLFRFLRFIERLRETEGDLEAPSPLGENENVVRIMSIHKAKGLEFPVVIVADLGKGFNFKDLSGDVLLHGRLGLNPLCFDMENGIKYPTLPYLAAAHRLRLEALSEELRILYVAMTRAREKLILTGTARNLPQRAESWSAGLLEKAERLSPMLTSRARCPLDWLMYALARHSSATPIRMLAEIQESRLLDDPSCWDVKVITAAALSEMAGREAISLKQEKTSQRAIADTEGTPLIDREKLRREVDRRLSWVYPWRPLNGLPVKLAVTELKRRFDVFNDGETPTRIQVNRFNRRPMFLQAGSGLTAAERGTVTHMVIQHVDLGRPVTAESLGELLQEMVTNEILTPEQAAAVDTGALISFFTGDLGRRLLARPEKVKRELPFSLAVPVAELYPALKSEVSTGETILVQGIIDCLVDEEDGFLLLDFKTGRLPADPLAEYREQIELYARAVSFIFRRRVKEAYVYYLDGGTGFKVI